jgi:hypothetical protein
LLGLLAEDGFVVKTIRAREAFFAHLVLAWGFTDIYVPFGDATDSNWQQRRRCFGGYDVGATEAG